MTDNIQSITARDESMNEGRNLDNFHSSAESYFFGNICVASNQNSPATQNLDNIFDEDKEKKDTGFSIDHENEKESENSFNLQPWI